MNELLLQILRAAGDAGAPLLKVLGATATTFFGVPVFTSLLVMLALDFMTGLYKARLLRKVASSRFGDMFERSASYAVIYLVLHLMTLSVPAPWDLFAKLFEGFVMTGLLINEALSVLENIKAIQHARGHSTPILDLLIDKLGLDLEKILKDFKKLEPPTVTLESVKAEDKSPAAVAGPDVTPAALSAGEEALSDPAETEPAPALKEIPDA